MFLRAAITFCFLGLLAAECQNGWTRFDDSCYLFSHLKFDFADADQFCQQHGGNLVHIETSRENDFLRNYIKDMRESRWWIGINDHLQEGRWVWQGTDEDITFSDWAPGEPNEGLGANCGCFWPHSDYHWGDVPCSYQYEPICESGLNSETEVIG